MTRKEQIGITFLLAFVAALGAAYLVMWMQAGAIFSPGHSGPMGLRLLAAPIAAIAAFALVYGIGSGRSLKLGFWLAAPLVLIAMWGVSFVLIGAGLPPKQALGLPVLALMPLGLWASLHFDAKGD